jgi:sec-independent protein translocase protein TatC
MATAIRTIGHDDRLSLVEHLDELRTRLIVCLAALAVAFGFCAWQNGRILDIVNRPLEQTAFKKEGAKSLDPFERQAMFQQQVKAFATSLQAFAASARASNDPDIRRQAPELERQSRLLAESVPPRQARKPITTGVGEPFTQTIKLAATRRCSSPCR